jgi:hypothetical protein
MSTRSTPKNEVDAVGVQIDSMFLSGRYNRMNPLYRKKRYAETRAKAAEIIRALDEFRAERRAVQ